MTGFKAKIIGYFKEVAEKNVCTRKTAMVAFMEALRVSDLDNDKNLNVGELSKLYLKNTKNVLFHTDMSEADLIELVKTIYEE